MTVDQNTRAPQAASLTAGQIPFWFCSGGAACGGAYPVPDTSTVFACAINDWAGQWFRNENYCGTGTHAMHVGMIAFARSIQITADVPANNITLTVTGPCNYDETSTTALAPFHTVPAFYNVYAWAFIPSTACMGTYTASVSVFSAPGIWDTATRPFELAAGQNPQYGPCEATFHVVNPVLCTSEPVNTLTGNWYYAHSDARLGGEVLPFDFSRTYNSEDPAIGRFGKGWSDSYSVSLGIDPPTGNVVVRAEGGQQYAFTKQANGTYVAGQGVSDSLVKNGNGTFTLTRRDQRSYSFTTTGVLTAEKDRNGLGLAFSYTAGNLTGITDAANRTVVFTYTGSLVTKLTLPDGRSVNFTYTGGKLTSVSDLRSKVTGYTYSAAGFLTDVMDANGHNLHVDYNADGSVLDQKDGFGNTVFTFSWDPMLQQMTVLDGNPNHGAWVYRYYGGDLIATVNPLGQRTIYRYDANSNLTETIDAAGNNTTFTYDSSGNMLTRTVRGQTYMTTTYTYDGKNNVASVKDPAGNITTFSYDARGNLTGRTQPTGILTQFARDPSSGLITSVTDPNGKITAVNYDASFNLTKITPSIGPATSFGYDVSGRRTSMTNADLNTWTYAYDNSDHLTSILDPMARTRTASYDGVGNFASDTDARGNTTAYARDADGRLSVVTAADASTTTYGYDAMGNMTSLTDAKGQITTFVYDAAYNLTSRTTPNAKTWTYTHDAAGNLTSRTLPSGGLAQYGYFMKGQLGVISYSDPLTPGVSLSYDANGNLASMTDGAGTQTRTYDTLDRLKTVTRGSLSFSYEYDPASNVTKRTYPDASSVSYTFDANERLITATTAGGVTTYAYDPASGVKTITLPNGNKAAIVYNKAGFVSSVTNTNGATTLSKFTYTRDANGNPTKVVTPTQTITNTYNTLNRLTKACYLPSCAGTGFAGVGYTYDKVGNMLTLSTFGSPAATTTYTYDAADQLTSSVGPSGTTSYTYKDGNQISAGGTVYQYDLEDRLISANVPGTTEAYAYDGFGDRVSTSVNGTLATKYEWDINASLPRLAAEKSATGTTLRKYSYGPSDTPMAMQVGSSSFYYLTDALGSTANLTSSTGAPQWSYTYQPFGSNLTQTKNDPAAPTNLIGFTGQLQDPTTGLYDLRARMYNPAIARFLQPDALTQQPMQPHLGSYVYANDLPTQLTDPSGMSSQEAQESSNNCSIALAMTSVYFGTVEAIVVIGETVLSGGINLPASMMFSEVWGGAYVAAAGTIYVTIC